jgi:hypothetical protein
MTKQTTITIETKSLLVIRSQSSSRSWCVVCQAEADVIELKLAELHGHGAIAIEQWLSSEDVHQAKAPDGSLLICLRSLLKRVQKTKPADRGLPRLQESEEE